MADFAAFHAFEHTGWNDGDVARVYHRDLLALTRGAIPHLLDATVVARSDRVLDLACGPGYLAAAARERGAQADGVDFAGVQVALAKSLHPGIRFVEGDAGALPFPDGRFEAVVCAFGFPHFPDPDAATAEAFRVLAAGGRFAYASWRDAARCVAFSMVAEIVREHGALDVGLPPGPDYYRCGDPEEARAMLVRAGFDAVTTTEIPMAWHAPSAEAVIEAVSTGTVRAAALLQRQSAADLARIRSAWRARIESYRIDGGYALPCPALVVSGKRM